MTIIIYTPVQAAQV